MNKNKTIQIRVTEEEHQQILEHSKHDKNISCYILKCILKQTDSANNFYTHDIKSALEQITSLTIKLDNTASDIQNDYTSQLREEAGKLWQYLSL